MRSQLRNFVETEIISDRELSRSSLSMAVASLLIESASDGVGYFCSRSAITLLI